MIFSSMFLTDRIFFLRFYRTPPQYTTELAKRTYLLLEWAVLFHFVFGIYMISNPKIFSFDSTQVDPSVEWATPVTEFVGKWVRIALGVSEDRFIQFHTVVYGLGIAFFVVLFVIERVTGLLSRLISSIVN